MCADGAKNVGERFAYSNAVEGLYRIGREEGVGAFTRGISANVVRSILMSKSSENLGNDCMILLKLMSNNRCGTNRHVSAK